MAKTATKKKAVKKAAKPSANGKKDQANKDIRWTDKKLEMLKALKKLGATGVTSAVQLEQLAKASSGKALSTLHPSYDFVVQGYVSMAQLEGERFHRVYITKKGLSQLKAA